MSDDYSDETRILSTAEFRIDDLVGKPGERSAVLSVLRGRRRARDLSDRRCDHRPWARRARRDPAR